MLENWQLNDGFGILYLRFGMNLGVDFGFRIWDLRVGIFAFGMKDLGLGMRNMELGMRDLEYGIWNGK